MAANRLQEEDGRREKNELKQKGGNKKEKNTFYTFIPPV